jgi:hypothetical protein
MHNKADLFETIRNKMNIILIKIERHSRECPMKEREKFWESLSKDLEDLSSLVKEKRSSNRLKIGRSTRTQKIFFALFAFLFLLESYQLWNDYKAKKSIKEIHDFIISK